MLLSNAQRAPSLGSARKAKACGSHSTGSHNEEGEDGVEELKVDVESEEEEEEEGEGADRDHSDFLSDAEWAARPPNATLQARQGALLPFQNHW